MSNLFQVGVSWLSSWFNSSILKDASSQEKQKLVFKGLIEESPKQIILHDQPAGKYVCFTGPDREQTLADYLQNLQTTSEELGPTDKIMMVAIGAIFTASQLIAPIMFIAERLSLDKFRLPDLPCKTGALASGLCLATSKSKELCLGLSALSCLEPVLASITVIKTIPDQIAYPDQKFNLPLNISDIFHESDPSLSMSVTAKQSNGEPLPTWFKFSIIPSFLGSIAIRGASDVCVVTNIAYVICDYGLELVDISNPHILVPLGSIAITYAHGIYVAFNIAYLTDATGLNLIDVSNSNKLSILGSISTTYALGVFVIDNIAYVADYDAGLKLIDVSTPSFPSIIGSISTSEAIGVYVISNIAYVADDTDGLKTIDVSNPSTPSCMGYIYTHGASGIYVVAKIAYVADHEGGLKIIDVSNPHTPSLLGSIITSYAHRVYVVADIAYIMDYGEGLMLIDVSDPRTPSIAGSSVFGSYGIYVASKIAYITDNNNLKLIDIYQTVFSGMPTCSERGKNYNITLQAKNNLEETAFTSFNLTVYDDGLKLAYPLANQNVHVANPFNFTVPNNTFSDRCADVLTYSTQLVDGTSLPGWLSFNANTLQFSGTPLAKEDIKVWDIEVKATDPYGENAKTSFCLDVYNKGIKVDGTIFDQQAVASAYFEYIFSNTLFIDEDDYKLDYRALSLNGNPLPLWLQFYSNNRTFSGIPSDQDVKTHQIRLYATDNYDEKSVDFEITVYPTNYQPPSVNTGIPHQEAIVGSFFSYRIPDDAFNNPNNNNLIYTAFLTGGRPLPSWLSFSSNIKTFTGSPKSEGTLSITVTVVDSYKSSAQTTFSLTSINKTLRMLKTFVNVGGPIISALGFLITAYANRAKIRNRLKKKQYHLSDKTLVITHEFTHKITKVSAEKIGEIKILKFRHRTWHESSFGEYVSNWWNDHFEELPAKQLMPVWLKYDDTTNELKAIPTKMTSKHIGDYKVIVLDAHGYKREEFILHVQEHPTQNLNTQATDMELGDPVTMQEPLLREAEDA